MSKLRRRTRRNTDIIRKKAPRAWKLSLERSFLFLLFLLVYAYTVFHFSFLSESRTVMENAFAFFSLSGIMFLLLYMFLLVVSYRPCIRLQSQGQLAVFGLINLCIILTAAILAGSGKSLFFIPLGLFSCAYAIIYNRWVSAVSTFILCIMIGLISNWTPEVLIGLLSGALVAGYYTPQPRRRSRLLKAGLLISMIHISVIFCFAGLDARLVLRELEIPLLIAGANGIVVGFILANGLFLVEKIFGITTGISLLELSDQNQPALKELVMKAPGTYHHSLLVGNLAETAAESIGANALLARVASYYHDIGKTVKPEYFTENMSGQENKHEQLTEAMSALVITSHVKDGVAIAGEYGLPRPIIDIIRQHHGTSRVEYFYTQAVEKYGSKEVDQNIFRYPGPRPRTKEAGIVMIADSVEAASRSLSDPSASRIRSLIVSIINSKLEDQQFDECALSMREISTIRESLIRGLNSMFHTRVSYNRR